MPYVFSKHIQTQGFLTVAERLQRHNQQTYCLPFFATKKKLEKARGAYAPLTVLLASANKEGVRVFCSSRCVSTR